MAKIEQSNTRGRFTPEQLKAEVRASKAFWNSPEGKAAAAKQEREKRSRKLAPAEFPALAKRSTAPQLVGGTQPQTNTLAARRRLLGKL